MPAAFSRRDAGMHGVMPGGAGVILDRHHDRPPDAAAARRGAEDDGMLHRMDIAVAGAELVVAGKALHRAVIFGDEEFATPRRGVRRSSRARLSAVFSSLEKVTVVSRISGFQIARIAAMSDAAAGRIIPAPSGRRGCRSRRGYASVGRVRSPAADRPARPAAPCSAAASGLAISSRRRRQPWSGSAGAGCGPCH